MAQLEPLHPSHYETLLERALEEDLGARGDITSAAMIDEEMQAIAHMIAKEDGVIAGGDIAQAAFEMVDNDLVVTRHLNDGEHAEKGNKILTVSGSAQSILTAERVALNMLSHLSGIATATNQMVQLIAHTKAEILCTRKTTPGFRMLEKYAVRAGGGTNHRFGLYDAVMVKDNHLSVYESLTDAVERVLENAPDGVKITVEVDTLKQLEELLKTPVDVVLLDNMRPEQVKQAVKMVNGNMKCEVSGGMTPKNVAPYAETGVDYISSGWITHSARNMDISLDMEMKPE